MRWPALAALTLLACDPPPPAPEPARDRGRLALLPAVGIAMELPAGSAVYQRPAGTWVLDMRPGMRSPRRVILAAAEPRELAGPPAHDPDRPWEGLRTRQLGAHGEIAFYTRVGGGGSGGVEADLAGRWTLGGRVLTVACQVQEEPSLSEGPDPTFCLPLLAAARSVPVADSPPVLGPDLTLGDPLRLLVRDLSPEP